MIPKAGTLSVGGCRWSERYYCAVFLGFILYVRSCTVSFFVCRCFVKTENQIADGTLPNSNAAANKEQNFVHVCVGFNMGESHRSDRCVQMCWSNDACLSAWVFIRLCVCIGSSYMCAMELLPLYSPYCYIYFSFLKNAWLVLIVNLCLSPALCCSEGAGRVVSPVHLSDVCCHLLAVVPKDTVSGWIYMLYSCSESV